jgi:hypothetical protein
LAPASSSSSSALYREQSSLRPYAEEQRQQQPALDPAPPAALRQSKGKSVLVADDVETNRMYATHLLKKADSGCTVTTCSNGAEAVDRALNETFDVIFMVGKKKKKKKKRLFCFTFFSVGCENARNGWTHGDSNHYESTPRCVHYWDDGLR